MKPRLKKLAGYWLCGFFPAGYGVWMGLGKKPSEAYSDWEKGRG